MSALSRFYPRGPVNVAEWLQPLPPDGSVPPMPGWRWLHTPGHTPGHVSLWREADGVLLASDALATMKLDSWSAYFTRGRELSRPSPPFTFDWGTTRESIGQLADLEPKVVAAGHGLPIAGDRVASELRGFIEGFSPPQRGRYVGSPAVAGEEGVEELPPSVPDPYARWFVGAAIALAAILTLARRRGPRR
jgi:glyoxylase-like metal-dependent hydrolase (beta-lactamase superfamily II)